MTRTCPSITLEAIYGFTAIGSPENRATQSNITLDPIDSNSGADFLDLGIRVSVRCLPVLTVHFRLSLYLFVWPAGSVSIGLLNLCR